MIRRVEPRTWTDRTTLAPGLAVLLLLGGCAGSDIRAEHYAIRSMSVPASPGDGTVLPASDPLPSFRSTDRSSARARR